jgi:hypothetical protein
MKENQPSKPGFFWAKSSGCKWYDLILNVYGEAPYLKIQGWSRRNGSGVYKYEPGDIEEWGPEIQDPNK